MTPFSARVCGMWRGFEYFAQVSVNVYSGVMKRAMCRTPVQIVSFLWNARLRGTRGVSSAGLSDVWFMAEVQSPDKLAWVRPTLTPIGKADGADHVETVYILNYTNYKIIIL
jgi:hypothetical protein